ncbi:MAG: glycine--tRNA ligase subunit beta [Alphaproteobacteria bacterium]|nr:glycine--tRNA ligase subunit beta [Alphaproteobacteria bacterium]
MAELLLELFSEEIPARMQPGAEEQVRQKTEQFLAEQGLSYRALTTFSSPRRLVLIVDGLPEIQPDKTVEKRGPRVDGPEAALDGFLKSTGLTKHQLEVRSTPKGDFYFAQTVEKGADVASVLKTYIEQLILNFAWPKSMQWGDHTFRWVRPLRNILCLFAGQVVPVSIEHLVANDQVSGHRFLSPTKQSVKNSKDYLAFLESHHVMLDRQQRINFIKEHIAMLAAGKNLVVCEDEGLIEEIAGLVEYPYPAIGTIDSLFMELPQEVLVSTMRNHQRYIALQDFQNKLSAHFIVVANIPANEQIIAGNERVLRARLSDAQFYWDTDKRVKLDEWAKKLTQVVFHARIGMIADKVSNMSKLAAAIAQWVPHVSLKQVERAAFLCKADLATGVVSEFPELQGIMGSYYAEHQGEDEAVVKAINEHYKPIGRSDSVPTQPVSVVIALADKLDTLVALFAINEKPTGSKDPFALRRAALGLIRIILDNQLRVPLKKAIDQALLPYGSQLAKHGVTDNVVSDVLEFIIERLKVLLKDNNIRHDLIQAVFADGKEDDLVRLVKRVEALRDFVKSADGVNLSAAFKRAANIVRIESQKGGEDFNTQAHKDLLTESAEIDLSNAFLQVEPKVDEALKEDRFVDAMTVLAQLRQPVDCFFDQVRVNSEDQAVRLNRLRLLSQFRNVLLRIGDFSQIEAASD